MTALDGALRKLRAAALKTERESQRAILLAWKATYERLLPYITAATAQALAVQADTPTGATFAVAALPTVRALGAAFAREVPLFAWFAAQTVTEAQRAAFSAAPELAEAAVLAALGTPPPGAIVPNLARAALFVPNEQAAQIAAALGRLAPGMGDAGAKAIADGVRRGKGAREIAKDVRLATNIARERALTISRHAINEGFRRSTLASYRASGVVVAYRRLCARNARTCAICWALDGKEYPLDRQFATHVCCRCCAIPIVRDMTVALPNSGPEAFAQLSAAEQRAILGKSKQEMYAGGSLDLLDLVAETFSPVYGAGMRERSLREVKAA